MNPYVRNIVYSSMALTLVVVLVAGLICSHHSPVSPTCLSLCVEITDADERQYLTTNEVSELLRRSDCYPVGKALAQVQTHAIEQLVRTHPMVRMAECFLTAEGDCRICLTQREPVYRVVTGAETYLVDSDRRRMPIRSAMSLSVRTASGHIGEKQAVGELYELMDYLAKTRYWNDRVQTIELSSPRMVELVFASGKRAILGPVTDYRTKLDKLRTLWEETEDYPEADARIYDLRFDHQVVTRN